MSARGRVRLLLSIILVAISAMEIAALDLSLSPRDLRIEVAVGGGYDLFIRKKTDIASVLLTESTKDPNGKADNFAYRDPEHNKINGDEIRMLNGKILPPDSKLYSLISSTPVADPVFGIAFHVYIPSTVVYGYPWSRSGSVSVGNGTYLNIRTFEKAYGDYAGTFNDNPFQITVQNVLPSPIPVPSLAPSPRPSPPVRPSPSQSPAPSPAPSPSPTPSPSPSPSPSPAPSGSYSTDAMTAFKKLSDSTDGKTVQASEEAPTSTQIGKLLEGLDGNSLDLVICLDTTSSMVPFMIEMKKNLLKIVQEKTAKFKTTRVGIMYFKDYWPDIYITKKVPFTANLASLTYDLNITPSGGGDIPEAVYEALFASATEFEWQADKRVIILVGDAPPHPVPKGKIKFDDVIRAVKASDVTIEIDAVAEPLKTAMPDRQLSTP